MKLNAVLAPLTVVMCVITVVTVLNHMNQQRAESSSSSAATTTSSSSPMIPSSERSLLHGTRSLLVTGVSSKIPEADDYRLISTVPWEHKDVSRLFRDAGTEMSCELLETGSSVVQPLVAATPDVAGPLGRLSAFSIRLQVGKSLGDGLPGVTRGIIEDYLKAHQLTIQPTFYCNEQSQLVMGPSLRAAFVRIDSPEQSIPAEAMIESSIGELRTLGACWDSDEEFTPATCRTLVLGFRYSLDADSLTAQNSSKREFEIVFLHLLPTSTRAEPKLAVFATSDSRTQFHLLEETDPQSVVQSAAITADVRFADVKLLGMYPEAPVVTRVRHRSLLSIPIDIVKAQIEGLGGVPPEGGFSAVLDELYYKTTGKEAPTLAPAAGEESPQPPTAPTQDGKSGFSV